MSKENSNGLERVISATVQAVPTVGRAMNMLDPDKIVPIKIHRIYGPVRIVCSNDQEFRQRQLSPIGVRIHHFPQLSFSAVSWNPIVAHEPFTGVVIDLLTVKAPGLFLMSHLDREIQRIDHDGSRSDDSLIHDRSQPACPAPLGSACNHKAFQRLFELLGRKLLKSIHRLDGTFGHWKKQRP